MKLKYVITGFLIFAWPLYYLYQRQLGAISFLLLAIFFFYLSMRELKAEKIRRTHGDGEESGPGA